MSTQVMSSPYLTGRSGRLRWLLPALAVAALLFGIWAWNLDGRAQPANAAIHSILLTDATAPFPRGASVRVESDTFVTHARVWTAYWSYYCLIPGMVTRWHTRLWLVRLHSGKEQSRRLLYGANSRNGPVSYTQILREPGPGSFRFIVDTTPHCVWSLRAPPVTNHSMASLGPPGGGIE